MLKLCVYFHNAGEQAAAAQAEDPHMVTLSRMSMLSPRYRPPDGPLRLRPCIVHRTLPTVIFFPCVCVFNHQPHVRPRLHTDTPTLAHAFLHLYTHTHTHSFILSHALAHIYHYLFDCTHPRLIYFKYLPVRMSRSSLSSID